MNLGIQQSVAKPDGFDSANFFPGSPARQSDEDQEDREQPRPMKGRRLHHESLRLGPITSFGPPANLKRLHDRRQLLIFWSRIPDGSPIGQEQFGPAPMGFFLAASQPHSQRWHKKIVRELI